MEANTIIQLDNHLTTSRLATGSFVKGVSLRFIAN
jgi:hypothetical protein